MEYKKPQATIIQGSVGIYPLTTADQVILADGTRLEKDGKINVDVANSADSAKLGGKAPEYYLQPRNLLDNSDFTNPVNQRGATSYTDATYGIDRWKTNMGVYMNVNVGTDRITLSKANSGGNFCQILPLDLIGKTVTYAVCTSHGVFCKSCVVSDTSVFKQIESKKAYLGVSSENGITTFQIYFNDSSDVQLDLYWAALYEGSYTIDTLPPYVPKGYAAELAECMRYYYQSWTGSRANTFDGVIICEAIALSRATNVVFPQAMRISNPTVTLYSPATGNTGKASEFVSDTEIDAGSVYLSRNGFTLSSAANMFEIGKHYCIHYSVSADL